MHLFRDLPIRSKLRLMIVVVSGLSLALAGALSLWGAMLHAELESRRELTSLADSLAFSVATPLDLDLPADARSVLDLLKHNETVLYGAVFREPDQARFAEYRKPNAPVTPPARPVGPGFHPRTLEYAGVVQNLNGRPIGTIYLQGDVARQRRIRRNCLLFLSGGVAVASLVALLLAWKIERLITGPLLALLQTAKHVSAERDYSVRAAAQGGDEVTELVNGFNDMLDQIQQRDNALLENQQNLEQQVTDRTAALRQANEKLAEARDRAEAANRAKTSFLAHMSHELRTPLNAVIGYSEIVREELEEANQTALLPDVNRINTAGNHLLTVINDILDLSKIEAGKLDITIEPVDLDRLVRDCVKLVEPLADQRGNTLELRLPDEVPPFESDPTRVRQVLYNLLSNACKFTKEGCVLIEGEVVEEPAGRVAVLRVTDSGIGMSPEQVAQIFQAFTQGDATTSRKYGGTGLGLAISRRLCEMMGGGLSVQSESGKGSTFTARILSGGRPKPTSGAVFPFPPPAAAALPVKRSRQVTVLIVDDDDVARDLLQRQLQREGYQTVCAGSGPEGLRLARTTRPNVITLDIFMPGMTGWEFLRALKAEERLADIPVIIVSMLEERPAGLALGAVDFLVKPVDSRQLVETISRHCPEAGLAPVLVVDDDADFRALVCQTLAKAGRPTRMAANGREALAALEQERPGLVLLDLMMPEMDGFEFLDRLRRRPAFRDLPVVVLTALDLSPAELERLQGGAARVLQKHAADSARWPAELFAQIDQLTAPPDASTRNKT